MCGLFGAVTTSRGDRAEVCWAVDELGRMAVTRGRDSAGVASRVNGHWTISRTLGAYDNLAMPEPEAEVWIGHTRYATQGRVSLANASPAAVGHLVATHNGDVDTTTIPGASTCATGRTDSHQLFTALAAHTPRRASYSRDVASLLEQVVGRVAMVWADTRDPADRIWLARGGMSPLAVALEGPTALWASAPGWLRQLGCHDIRTIPTGSLWSLNRSHHGVELEHHEKWLPTVRLSDRAASAGAWRGLTPLEQTRERGRFGHYHWTLV